MGGPPFWVSKRWYWMPENHHDRRHSHLTLKSAPARLAQPRCSPLSPPKFLPEQPQKFLLQLPACFAALVWARTEVSPWLADRTGRNTEIQRSPQPQVPESMGFSNWASVPQELCPQAPCARVPKSHWEQRKRWCFRYQASISVHSESSLLSVYASTIARTTSDRLGLMKAGPT